MWYTVLMNRMNNKIPDREVIVVGGAGYIGSHVCKMIAEHDCIPITFDNLSTGHLHAVKWGPFHKVDLRDRMAVYTAMDNYKTVKTIIHAASFIEVELGEAQPAEYYENNVLGALNLLLAMRRTDADQLIFSSTCATYGEAQKMPLEETTPQNPQSVYGKTKLAIEHMIQSFHRGNGLKFVTLRYFNASGADASGEIGEEHHPETHLIPNALKSAAGIGKPLTLFGTDFNTPDGTCIRDYIHVNDIALAHINALRAFDNGLTNVEVNIGTGLGVSNLEIISAIERITGLKVPYISGQRRTGDLTQLYANTSAAKALLNFEPRHSNLDNIIKTAWFFHTKSWGLKGVSVF